ncbi:ABC transporter permease protein [Mucinivorans hirudinis]|uniref:ABC transporter permease protein n=1 Tax=Mucinivorans hirudinis TaxID=1433126 RepID=A0A060R7S5_9BACT|nr:ABC transporter permease protein [Mucinivorans hirudinis]
MNFPLFIARRLAGVENSRRTRIMVGIAVVSVALSVAVIIVALSIVGGFREQLAAKVRGFSEDIVLTKRTADNPNLTEPFALSHEDVQELLSIDKVEKVEPFSTANGLISSGGAIEGVVLKGVEDYSFLSQNLVSGEIPTVHGQVLISAATAAKTGLKSGDSFSFIVLNQTPLKRLLKISGVYSSGLEEFDSKFLFADISLANQINGWEEGVYEGYQIRAALNEQTVDEIWDSLPVERWNVQSVQELYSQFFDWVVMLEMNSAFVLVIMLIVAVINMLGGVLVIILESVRMVGVLKTQGIRRGQLQKIFLYRSGMIVIRGLIFGNLIGIGLCLVQQYFSVITLDASAYLLSVVPIKISFAEVGLLNIGTFFLVTLLMIVPTLILERISPAESVKFS